MNFLSHLFISRELYKYFKSEIELNKWAFAFGNVKPDLPPACFKARHTLENYFSTVSDRTDQLQNDELSLKEFSVKLGEVCHFACDFFCYYHSSAKLHKKNLYHFIYEIRLQLQLNILQLKKKLKIPVDFNTPCKSFAAIIYEMRQQYLAETKSMKKDIDYALQSAICIFKTILQSVNSSLETAWQPDAAIPSPFPTPLDIEGENYESSVIC